MTVSELKNLLDDYPDEAQVYIMMQQSWPFECQLHGVAQRKDFMGYDDPEEDGGGETDPNAGVLDKGWNREPRTEDDVFLVEGSQISYGDKTAWEAARRH